ncbi:formate dehydrogenase subunit alpha [Prosthecobacter vanneervenii]|uniref:Formate dehydrogenase major subunit n=1 Tax=Prosthecobacter vanneervenii TaxID=48466 RepID=A0A7W7Y7Z9_9BACT|nr:formate dehydrogenase subunit alpha [Prosthecobacter vanneervenii]MBB5031269.1 formate dehydrogenase major subunit [Prosthecobacter vanneervenii]
MVKDLSTLTAFIDGDAYSFNEGDTLLDFIDRHRGRGHVPTLCDAPQLDPYGACRVCSVEVALQADGPRRVVASCHTPLTAGMHVFTESQKVRKLRKNIVELVLTDHPLDCLTCEVSGNCELQTVAAKVGIRKVRYPAGANHLDRKKDLSHAYMTSELSKCINCARCVRACDEIQGQHVLSMHGRGFNAKIIKGLDQSFADSECVSCGACSQACPTSAISDVFFSKSIEATKKTRTICTYCGVGCNLNVATKGDQVLSIQAPVDAEVNHAHTCLKGRFAFKFYNHKDRLRTPLIKQPDGQFKEATWQEAYDHIFTNLTRIKADHGGQSVAGISSARCTNEENYLMQKFIRNVMGTNNIDCCARVCHSPTAWGMQKSFGTGAATNSYEDIEHTRCILVIGANPTEGHPVTGARLKQHIMKGTPLIVIDPRKIELVPYAKHHLQLRPGTNVALLNMFARCILDAGLVKTDFIKKRCENWEEFEAGLRALDLAELEKITGVSIDLVRAAAIEYASAEAAMSFHGLGVTEHQQGAKTVMLISNLAMMTGNIGRPGVGVNPLRGQNNVQGAADMGCQPHQGAGYYEMADPQVQQRYADFYGVPTPTEPGWKIPQMFDAAIEGKLKALWLMGEDVVQTDPDAHHVRHAMESLEFLVVQEIFMTETAKYADVILPASSFLEKSGTFTNAERRVQRVNATVKPLPGTKPDGQILCEVLQRFGVAQPDYTPDGVLAEVAQIVPFFKGITWENLGENGLQWPVKEGGVDTQIMHQEQFTRGKGHFHFFSWKESTELETHRGEFPFILTTGRILEHYNCGTMTRRTGNSEIVGQDYLSLNPADAQRKGIRSGDIVRLFSARGEVELEARVTDEVKPGILYTTFHFPDAMVNNVTGQGCDGDTMCPEYKVVAADVELVRAGKPKKKRMMEMV